MFTEANDYLFQAKNKDQDRVSGELVTTNN